MYRQDASDLFRYNPRPLARGPLRLGWDTAKVAELVDALDLGSSGETRESSSLSFRTIRRRVRVNDEGIDMQVSLTATGGLERRLEVAIPDGFEGQVRPRSGLAAKHGVTVLYSPGTVDADYRGEINVLLINHGDTPFPIRRGERIAQMVIAPVVQAQLVPVVSLSATDRGSGGFGSTGR